MIGRNRIALGAAVLAAVALLAGGLPEQPAVPVPAGRATVEQEWPGAARSDLTGLTVEPLLFLDATTAVRLGPRVLRAETAPLAVLATLASMLESSPADGIMPGQ
jgi:hypothetical protein